MQPVISCYMSCLPAAAVSCSSPSVRPRRLTRARHPAALLPFSTDSDKYWLRRHRFAPPAAINISPDALIHPTRESKRQTEKKNTGGKTIEETADSVTLRFPVTEIVGDDESIVNNAIKVAIDHGDVLTISLKEEKQKRQPSLLDVRLLMTPGYEKVEWQSKKVDGKVWLEVTIKKKAPTDGTRIVDISAIEEKPHK